MNFTFDTETTGLPTNPKNKWRAPHYSDVKSYESCRLLSIAWIIAQHDRIVETAYFVVKPVDIEISKESEAVHHISREKAMEEGIELHKVLSYFHNAFSKCSSLIGHNVDFDLNVLRSEFVRCGRSEIAEEMNVKKHVCTMKKGKKFMNFHKYPKLTELYYHIHQVEMEDAHHAYVDTMACFKCFVKMFPSNEYIFFIKDKEVYLTEQQKNIVYAHRNKSIIVHAAAGSGKSSTMVIRIKRLIDLGVEPRRIMMTTFTRDAAKDMKDKLADVMGYDTDITVGTIDSISKNAILHDSMSHVSEYSHSFLEYIKNTPSYFDNFEYLFVDEFQDINKVQFNIIREFHAHAIKVFAVGDDAQNIYTFRGSSVEYILNFDKYFPDSLSFHLTANFRSTKEIVALANSSNAQNLEQIPKVMTSALIVNDRKKSKPTIAYFSNITEQYSEIVKNVEKYLQDGILHHEIAVLSPVNYNLYAIEENLSKHGIPCVLLDGKTDVRTMQKNGHVCLSTIHKAKGLEWDVVFLINMSDDIVPKNKDAQSVEESRRLFYVGITRPRMHLEIYYVASVDKPYVTRFVSECDRNTYDFRDFDQKYISGISKSDFVKVENDIDKLVAQFNGEDFRYIRESGLLPNISDIRVSNLYQEFTYENFIVADDICGDFAIFLKTIATRIFCEVSNTQPSNDFASAIVAAIYLDACEFGIYKKYRYNFTKNIAKFSESSNFTHKILETDAKQIASIDMPVVMDILGQLRKSSKTHKFPIEKIPVFSRNFLPTSFIDSLAAAKIRFENMGISSTSILDEIFEISKCKNIVKSNRRKMLFKKTTGNDFSVYNDLFESVKNTTNQLVCDPSHVHFDEEFSRDGLIGENDLRCGNKLISYAVSTNDDIKLDHIIALMCKKMLCLHDINYIGIHNILKGKYYELDVSAYEKAEELFTFVSQYSNKRRRIDIK